MTRKQPARSSKSTSAAAQQPKPTRKAAGADATTAYVLAPIEPETVKRYTGQIECVFALPAEVQRLIGPAGVRFILGALNGRSLHLVAQSTTAVYNLTAQAVVRKL